MRTNGGADFQANVMGATSGTGIGTGAFAPANYIALSTSATAPAATDTTLGSELVAASGGLIRKQASYSHTTAATNYVLTAAFTANTNDGASNTIQKIGVFNASSAGTLVFETAVPSPPTLVSGDIITVTETVNI